MKRMRFLGAAAAATLAGCAGRAGIPSTPVAKPSGAQAALKIVDTGESRLAALSLKHPIIGEIGTYTGATPPNGWVFAQGQALPVAQYGQLFSILGTAAGGDGKTSFDAPKPPGGPWILAVAGLFPSSPSVLAGAGRQMFSAEASLGPGAQRAAAKAPPPPSADVVASRALLDARTAPRERASRSLSAAALARVRDADVAARTAALAALSPENAARLTSLVDDAVAGRRTLGDVAIGLASALSPREAAALLQIHDASAAAFRPTVAPHANAPVEAAHFLVSVAFTDADLEALTARANP